MREISKKIQETEQAIRETNDTIAQIQTNLQQMNDHLVNATNHNNRLVARLQTLKEIEAAGAGIFTDEPSEQVNE